MSEPTSRTTEPPTLLHRRPASQRWIGALKTLAAGAVLSPDERHELAETGWADAHPREAEAELLEQGVLRPLPEGYAAAARDSAAEAVEQADERPAMFESAYVAVGPDGYCAGAGRTWKAALAMALSWHVATLGNPARAADCFGGETLPPDAAAYVARSAAGYRPIEVLAPDRAGLERAVKSLLDHSELFARYRAEVG